MAKQKGLLHTALLAAALTGIGALQGEASDSTLLSAFVPDSAEAPAAEAADRQPATEGSAHAGKVAAGGLILFGSEPGGLVFDGDAGGTSPLVAALLEHLAQPGVGLRPALAAVGAAVAEATAGQQRPLLVGDLGCELVLAALPAGEQVAVEDTDLCAGSLPGSRRIALVVGNSAYKGDGHSWPVNTRRDVLAMSGLLAELGFEVDILRDLTGPAMRAVAGSFGRRAEAADLVLFYFSGVGDEAEGEARMLGIEAWGSDPTAGDPALAVDFLVDALAGPAAQLMILDTQFGGLSSGQSPQPGGAPLLSPSESSPLAR